MKKDGKVIQDPNLQHRPTNKKSTSCFVSKLFYKEMGKGVIGQSYKRFAVALRKVCVLVLDEKVFVMPQLQRGLLRGPLLLPEYGVTS